VRLARIKLEKGTPKPKGKAKIVLVKWEDATHQDDTTEPIGTMMAWTTGFLIYRNKKEVSVCMEVFADGDKKAITTIPAGMVRFFKILAEIPFTTDDK